MSLLETVGVALPSLSAIAAIICILCSIFIIVLDRVRSGQARDIERDLDEIRKCNADFARATALFKIGAYQEAEEVLNRWRVRSRKREDKYAAQKKRTPNRKASHARDGATAGDDDKDRECGAR